MSTSTVSTPASIRPRREAQRLALGVTAVMLPELDFDGQLALCQSLGVRYYQYRPREISPAHHGQAFQSHGNHRFDLTPQRLLREGAALTRRLRSAGIECWGTLPSIDASMSDDELRIHFDGAVAADAHRISCCPAPYPSTTFDYADALARAVQRYHHIVNRLARPRGLKVLIETHRQSLACSPCLAWNICRHFQPRDLGVIFDLANFALEGAVAPTLAVSILSPYIDCVHVGGTRRLPGGDEEFCAMGDSSLHLPAWLDALRDAGSHVPLIVEDFRGGIAGERKLEEGVRYLRGILAPTKPIVSRDIGPRDAVVKTRAV